MKNPFPSLLALAAVLAAPVQGASVVLWPVDPSIASDAQATALWIENKGTQPVTFQVRSLAWTQADGEDRYTAQDAIVASPPIATIAGGKRQLVRIVRRVPQSAAEQSYRLLIDELPVPADTGRGDGDGDGDGAHLTLRMRYSIPLFTYGADVSGLRPLLRVDIETEGGRRFLVIRNLGTRHARLTDLREQGGVKAAVISGLLGYVLPGRTMRWAIPADVSTSAFTIGVNGADIALTRGV